MYRNTVMIGNLYVNVNDDTDMLIKISTTTYNGNTLAELRDCVYNCIALGSARFDEYRPVNYTGLFVTNPTFESRKIMRVKDDLNGFLRTNGYNVYIRDRYNGGTRDFFIYTKETQELINMFFDSHPELGNNMGLLETCTQCNEYIIQHEHQVDNVYSITCSLCTNCFHEGCMEHYLTANSFVNRNVEADDWICADCLTR